MSAERSVMSHLQVGGGEGAGGQRIGGSGWQQEEERAGIERVDGREGAEEGVVVEAGGAEGGDLSRVQVDGVGPLPMSVP